LVSQTRRETFATPLNEMTEEKPPKRLGRARRGSLTRFTWGDLQNINKILAYDAFTPPPCICGGEWGYWLYIDGRDRLMAECRTCKYKRVWSKDGKAWGPFNNFRAQY